MPIPLNKKVNDYDSTLAGRLIRYVENPDSIGFINGLWYSPKYDSRFKPGLFDPNNFGMGVDRLKNEYVGNDEFKFHKDSQGKEYITPEEERNLRNHSIANAEDSYNNRLTFAQKTIGSDVTPSEMKKAITISAIYNLGAGTVSNELFEDKALIDSLLNGSDIGYSNEVNKYFKAHNKGERGPKTNEFINNQSTGVNSSQTPAPIKSPFFSSLTEKLHNAIPHGAYGRWSEGGSLNSPWDGLSLQEKAEMMKVAVRNGIYNLNEIKQKYNEFTEGGKLSEDKEYEKSNKYPIGGYIDYATNNVTQNVGAQHYVPGALETVNNVLSYMPITGTVMDIGEFVKNPTWGNLGWAAASIGSDILGASLLKGSRAATKEFRAAKQAEREAEEALDAHRKSTKGIIARSVREEDARLAKQLNDARWNSALKSPFWDKVIECPIYGAWLAEDAGLNSLQQNTKASGGRIHIKPENKGKFTALKKRTGHSATWFKEHGTPAQKKMATFALNSRHWNKHALGGNLYGTGGTWKQQHEKRWHDFLLGKGLAEADASRLAGFFTTQDGLESAGGKSSAARQKNNYGGMQKNGKNITYDSVNAYMEDKWRMMNSRFKPALSAQSIDEYATILGNPETAGKGYLYYVTDKAKYDPKSPTWKAAQTKHMHNYINGMRAWAGKGKVKFNDPVVPKPQVVEEVPYSTYVAPAPTVMPQFIPYNPEVFFGSTQPATPEPVFPIAESVQETPTTNYEKQDRMDGIRRLGMVMGLLNNTQSTNPFDLLTASYFNR